MVIVLCVLYAPSLQDERTLFHIAAIKGYDAYIVSMHEVISPSRERASSVINMRDKVCLCMCVFIFSSPIYIMCLGGAYSNHKFLSNNFLERLVKDLVYTPNTQ